ncbi:hypothetical protein GCM10009772_15360 [Pseudonocardia alni subsp. carboxydivorans]
MSRIPNRDHRPEGPPASPHLRPARPVVAVLGGSADARLTANDWPPARSRQDDNVLVTAVGDGLEHEVAADELTVGRATGRYRALCGLLVDPASLTVAAGVPCRGCAVEAAPAPDLAGQDAQRSRRETASWLRGLRARTARLATSAGGLDVAA